MAHVARTHITAVLEVMVPEPKPGRNHHDGVSADKALAQLRAALDGSGVAIIEADPRVVNWDDNDQAHIDVTATWDASLGRPVLRAVDTGEELPDGPLPTRAEWAKRKAKAG